ncbi:MAG TPA: histidine kinase [Solirubrobacteraceae bacterium]|nr:histidine kinase [Solirubrobacteraceae bacterium]
MHRSSLSPDRNQEAGLILVAAVIGAATLASVWPKHSPGLGAAQGLAGIAACLSLATWRTRPVAVAVLTTALAVFSPMAVPATVLAVVNAALHTRLRTYLLLGAYVIAVAGLHAVLYLHHTGYLTDLIVAVPSVGVGLVARVRRTRAEIDAKRLLDEARAAERRRIAREMHDVLAHRISMVSVHAGALEYHPDVPPEDVAKAAGVIRSSAHAALGELREVINLLRSPDDRADEQDRADVQPPQPTLDDVAHLIDESREAGMRVGFELRLSEPDRVPVLTGRTIYRIVQEGLTNARKHAPGSDVDVDIGQAADGTVTVVVRNQPAPREPAAPTPPGSGTGLIGLAERVALSGGRLDHGPTPHGGYAVNVTLPVPR